MKKKGNVQVFVDPEYIHNAMIELVTENGLPLSVVEKSEIQKLAQPYLNSMSDARIKKYNRKNIRNSVLGRSVEMNENIKKMLQGN